MVTIIIILITLGLLSKVLKIVRDIALTVLSVIGSLIGILVLFRLTYKWIIIPGIKLIKWISIKSWQGLQWIGKKMQIHYMYRDDNNYWSLVATSMDRSPI